MKIISKFFILLFFISTISSADNSVVFSSSKSAFYCPELNQLTKNETTMTWSAPGGWKSYGQSFVEKVAEFRGAQWEGVNIGQIACVYTGENKLTFPIVLVFNKLTSAPVGGAWVSSTPDSKQKYASGYYNCPSKIISDCPFHPIIQASDTNANEIVSTIKQQPAPQQQGF